MKSSIALVVILGILTPTATGDEIRVAVVSEIQSPLWERISEQLQLRMFDTPSIRVITTGFRDKLKDQPQLNSIRDDSERARFLGKVLEVQFIVQMEFDLMRSEPSGYWIRDVSTGTMAARETLPNLDPGEIAARLAKAIRLSVEKATNPEIPRFAFVGTVSDDVSTAHKAAVRPFSEAVHQILASAPGLMFVGDVEPSILLASNEKGANVDIVASLALATDDEERVTVTATVRKANLEFVAQTKTTGDHFDAQLVNDVVSDLCAALKTAAPTTLPDLKLIGARYFAEAQSAWKQKDFARALVAGETALLYQPDNEQMMALMAEILLSNHVLWQLNQFLQPNTQEKARWSVSELQQFIARGIYLEGELIAREKQEYFSHSGDGNPEMFQRLTRVQDLVQRYREHPDFDLTKIEMHLKASYRQAMANLSEQAAKEEAYFGEYTTKLIDRMSFCHKPVSRTCRGGCFRMDRSVSEDSG